MVYNSFSSKGSQLEKKGRGSFMQMKTHESTNTDNNGFRDGYLTLKKKIKKNLNNSSVKMSAYSSKAAKNG